MRPPDQPVERDEHGTIRFRKNAIVRYLLDVATERSFANMNHLAMCPFSREDRVQFAQLIGYSVSGYQELDYVHDADWDRAERAVEKLKVKR